MNQALLNNRIQLENDRALLVPLEDSRNHELKEIIFNDAIWTYMGMYVRSESDFENYLANALRDKEKGICYPFLIIDKHSGRVAGSTRYGYLNVASEKCEIGWTWYGTDFQGTGLNQACKFELLKFGFENIGFRRIQFSADEENLRSQKAIQKLGAQKEGLFRNNYIDSKGESRNDVYFSITREDWPNVKAQRFSSFLK